MAKPITMFSWGYYGWGPHTKELLRLSAAIEKERGYRPPLFVDIRLRRSGRAEGFRGPAFENLAGDRYLRMSDLGNESIRTRQDSQVIRRPEAASDLLSLAVERAKRKQRVIFFCGCEFPCDCHRSKVTDLLINVARQRGIRLEVSEWPGGEPVATALTVKVDPRAFKLLRKSHIAVYLPDSAPLARLAGVPIGTIMEVTDGADSLRISAWCAQPVATGWCLPVLWGDRAPIATTLAAVTKWRKAYGCESRKA